MCRGDGTGALIQLIGIQQFATNRRCRLLVGPGRITAPHKHCDGIPAAHQHSPSSGQEHRRLLVDAASLKALAPIAQRPVENLAPLRAKIDQLHTKTAARITHLGSELKFVAQRMNDRLGVQATRPRAGHERAKLGLQITG
jgi:hypothetical protein